MTTTYRLNVNELTDEILQSIKAAFKNRDIEIIVSDEVDETAYLLASPANEKRLLKSIEHSKKKDKLVTVDMDRLKQLIAK